MDRRTFSAEGHWGFQRERRPYCGGHSRTLVGLAQRPSHQGKMRLASVVKVAGSFRSGRSGPVIGDGLWGSVNGHFEISAQAEENGDVQCHTDNRIEEAHKSGYDLEIRVTFQLIDWFIHYYAFDWLSSRLIDWLIDWLSGHVTGLFSFILQECEIRSVIKVQEKLNLRTTD